MSPRGVIVWLRETERRCRQAMWLVQQRMLETQARLWLLHLYRWNGSSLGESVVRDEWVLLKAGRSGQDRVGGGEGLVQSRAEPNSLILRIQAI